MSEDPHPPYDDGGLEFFYYWLTKNCPHGGAVKSVIDCEGMKQGSSVRRQFSKLPCHRCHYAEFITIYGRSRPVCRIFENRAEWRIYL